MNRQMESIKDLLQSSVQFKDLSLELILLTLTVSLIIGLFIFFIYRKTYVGTIYSYSFNTTLITMTLITSMMILVISSNLVLSLGMVGALSIVRFRAAIKNPNDIVYLFWSITVGISVGAKFYTLAVIGSLFIAVVIYVLSRLNSNLNSYLLVVQCENKALTNFFEELKTQVKYEIKSQSIIDSKSELTLSIKGKLEASTLLLNVNNIEGVLESSLLKYEE